jgi:hypothetical protein
MNARVKLDLDFSIVNEARIHGVAALLLVLISTIQAVGVDAPVRDQRGAQYFRDHRSLLEEQPRI